MKIPLVVNNIKAKKSTNLLITNLLYIYYRINNVNDKNDNSNQ